MNLITNAFTKGYCDVTAIDSLILTFTVLLMFVVCHFTWFVISDYKKRSKR